MKEVGKFSLGIWRNQSSGTGQQLKATECASHLETDVRQSLLKPHKLASDRNDAQCLKEQVSESH